MKRAASLLLAGVITVLLVPALVAGSAHAAAQPTGAAANQASSWEKWLESEGVEAQCFKHDADRFLNVHGYIVGKQVKLYPFNQAWFGDHWALLVVKGGTGNTVVLNPVAGVGYTAPPNNGGNIPDVSHWIVCKGETPEQPPTTTRPEPPTTTLPPEEPPTTTTPPEIPTTTVPEVPTTTVPQPPVTTVKPEPPVTTVVTPEPPATTVPQITHTEEQLAFTGSGEIMRLMLLGAALCLIAGTAIEVRVHRKG